MKFQEQNNKKIVIGCIYRHPSSKLEHFHDILKEKLEYISRSGFETYIAGDTNINFLKYATDKKTSDYLDMLFSFGFMPLITKATRITHHSKTLMDHIYTNAPEKIINTGVCLADISDHLPCFCTSASKVPTVNQQKIFRDFSNFNKELYTEDLNKIDFMSLISSDANESMNNINTMQDLTDKYVPLKKTSNSKKKQLKKPWISNCILISIKKRQKLFKSHFLSGDPGKIQYNKTYNNRLNKVKAKAKKTF